jgi:ectoine hydroxylase-related dioxygenase (phytanoyl-CoA dioxygenase family)
MEGWTLPGPTIDYEHASRDLREFGYCVIADLLVGEELAILKGSVRFIVDEERRAGTLWYSNGNQKIFMLINHGAEYLRLVEHEAALRFVWELLGPDPLLASITANITQPGNVQQKLHADQQYIPAPWHFCFAMNVIWILDDFTEYNGATVVVPGSHLLGQPPTYENVPQVPIIGPAGSAVILDGRLWHGSGVNKTESDVRAAILAHYCAPFIRQQENVCRSIDPNVRGGLSASQRKLLGYDIWSGLGVVNGFPRDWNGRKSRSGPTNADGIFDE